MPAWITDLIALAPWLAALALLAWAGVKVFPWLRKLMHFIDDVAGEPARSGVPARPGLMERMTGFELKQDEQAAALEVVRHEVTTNHGSSLKDAVRVLDGRVANVQATLDGQAQWQKRHEEKSDAAVARIHALEMKEKP